MDRLKLLTIVTSDAAVGGTFQPDPRTNHSGEAMWPRNCCHTSAGGAGRRKNLSANSQNLTL